MGGTRLMGSLDSTPDLLQKVSHERISHQSAMSIEMDRGFHFIITNTAHQHQKRYVGLDRFVRRKMVNSRGFVTVRLKPCTVSW